MPVGQFRRAARPLDEMLQSPNLITSSAGLTSTDWQPLPASLE